MRPAVFFDRDDTLITCRAVVPDGDLGDPALVQLRPYADSACQRLKDAGFTLVVVSNQGGVARGRYDEAAVHAVNERVNELLGGLIERFYFCPHHPKGTVAAYTREHPWRKPAPGMLLAAARDMDLDLARSWMVGDSPRDAQAGSAAGCRSILLDTAEYGPTAPSAANSGADFQARNLAEAATIIVHDVQQAALTP